MTRTTSKTVLFVIICLQYLGSASHCASIDTNPELVIQLGYKSFVNEYIEITDISYSPDGKMLVSTDDNGHVIIWDTDSGDIIRTITAHSQHVSFRPDGKAVATLDRNKLSLWDIKTGDVLDQYTSRDVSFSDILFQPRGGLIALLSGTGNILRLLDVDARAVQCNIKIGDNPHFVNKMSFSPVENRIASGSEGGRVVIWNTENCEKDRQLTTEPSRVTQLEYSPNGKLLAIVSSDDVIKIWNTDSWSFEREIKIKEAVGGSIKSISFSPDSKYIAVGCDDGINTRSLALYDVETGQSSFSPYHGTRNGNNIVRMSPDGKSVAATNSLPAIHIFNLDTPESSPIILSRNLITPEMVFLSPNGQYLVLALNHPWPKPKLFIWNMETGETFDFGEVFQNSILGAMFSPDSTTLRIVDDRHLLTTLNLQNEKVSIIELKSPGCTSGLASGFYYSMDFSQDARLFAALDDCGKIHVWDLDTGDVLSSFALSLNIVRSLKFNTVGNALYVIHGTPNSTTMYLDMTLDQIDLDTQQVTPIYEPKSHEIGISPDGRFVAEIPCFENSLLVRELKSGEQIHSIPIDPVWGQEPCIDWNTSFFQYAFSPDGRLLAATDWGKPTLIVDAREGNLLHTLPGNRSYRVKSQFSFTPDGGTLATVDTDNVLVSFWDTRTGSLRGTFAMFEDEHWVVYDESGHFQCDVGTRTKQCENRYIRWRVGDEVTVNVDVSDQFRTPNLLKTILNNKN